MNLLVVSVDFLPHIGGISLMTHHVSNAFVDLGHHVRVLAPRGANVFGDYDAQYELMEDVESSARTRETPAYHDEILRIKKLLAASDVHRKIDHVLLMHVFYYGWPVKDFCRDRCIPYSVFIHGFEFRSQLIKPRGWREKLGVPWRVYVDLRHSTLEVTRDARARFVNSSITGRLLDEAGVGPAHVVGCGLPSSDVTERLRPPGTKSPSYRRRMVGHRDPRYVLGFLGRVVPSKNVQFLVDLITHLPAADLAIAGEGDVEVIRDYARQKRVSDRVQILGPVSEQEKWDFLTAIDLLCLPSRAMSGGQMEGFGIVLIEATVRGTPVAVSYEGGMRDFVLDHNGLYLEVEDARKSAETIRTFLSDCAAVDRCVSRAQRLVREQLTYDKICSRMLAEMAS